ncbi:retrovirus-related pol polyprotein from transposon TNT 1-94 [Tanacetum coccineum]
MVTKFDIDKFDGKISFAIWKVHMQAVLTHHGYKKALRGIAHKPQSMSDEDWLELDEKALATIQLFLTQEVLQEDRLYTLLSKQNYDYDVEPESGEGLVARGRSFDRERECKGNNEKKPKKAAEVSIAKGDSDGDVYLAIDIEKYRDELIVDSSCTFHMTPHRSWFITYESFNGGNMYIGNHSICSVNGKGNIQVKMHVDIVRTITRVQNVPDLKRNLISLSSLEANGCKYSSEGRVMKIFKGSLVLMKAIQSSGLYVLQCTVVSGTTGVATSKASLDDSKLWHYHLGHMGEKAMKYLTKKGRIKVSCNFKFCEHCVFGKQKNVSFSPGIHRTRDALDYIHSDLWDHLLLCLEEHKDEVFPTFKEWKMLIENQTGKRIKKLRTDNGLEFCGETFNALCRKYGIERHHTLVRTPQQNGIAEGMNRTITDKVRCIISHANLDKDFWVEAATTTTYLINYSPHRSLDGNILEILWSGKLVPLAVKFIFMGYGSGVKGYRVWCPNPKYQKIIHSRDVTFNKDVIINSGKHFVPPHNVDNNRTKGKVEFEFDFDNSTHTQPLFNDEHICWNMLVGLAIYD